MVRGATMSAEWVRRNYPVDFKRGDRVILHDHALCPAYDLDDAAANCGDTRHDRHGVIISFPNQYVGVRFDGDTHRSICHPTWHLFKEGS